MRQTIVAALLAAAARVLLACAPPVGADEDGTARQKMVQTIARHDAAINGGHRRIEPVVLAAMEQIPRHQFVPEALRGQAYEDRPLPIGDGQTISQPFIVAFMTHLLAPERGDIVLEVGTGSGYQAAVLSRLVRHVYTIEIVEPLASQAEKRLASLGYDNVTVRLGDGYAGWPEHGPFDGILITAGADHIPEPLIEQLRPGGRLVMPVGHIPGNQQLVLLRKDLRGNLSREQILPVAFVPLTGRVRP